MKNKKQFKVTLKETIQQDGITSTKNLQTLYTYAASAQQARKNAQYRTGVRPREDYLPGDGALIRFYVAEEVPV